MNKTQYGVSMFIGIVFVIALLFGETAANNFINFAVDIIQGFLSFIGWILNFIIN